MPAPPVLVDTRKELSDLLSAHRTGDRRVALVPTMGALHEGHVRLIRRARAQVGDGPLAVSIFVNPLQFGADEDLARYPRTLEKDLQICDSEGVDLVFAPSVDEVYPGGPPQVTIDPGALAEVLEGAVRPGHFTGVLTVVAKLFGAVRPDVAVFGEKDYQQLVLVRRMVADLCLDVDVVGVETVREPDGLALSSRNRYLDGGNRFRALALSRALFAARTAAVQGFEPALDAARAELSALGADVDYVVITDPDLALLAEPVHAGTEGRILVAARVGTTRLIDNLPLTIGTP